MKKINLPIIVGPTASGKSALALALARKVDGEIVSCDSMQFYRGMDIGTAKPTLSEQSEVRHHMIDIAEPDEPFSCADYATRASSCIEDIIARGKMPIVCGGTGLYLDALLRGGLAKEADTDPIFREEMKAFAEENGNEALHARLAEIDPDAAAATHPNNVRRVIRALEIFHVSGVTKTETDRKNSLLGGVFNPLAVCLSYSDREVLYGRIDSRVDLMMKEGLADEVRRLDEAGVFDKSPTAAGAIGYKELLPAIRGKGSMEEAVEELKKATRRYAKRQITWFSAKPYLTPLTVEGEPTTEKFENLQKKAEKLFLFLK